MRCNPLPQRLIFVAQLLLGLFNLEPSQDQTYCRDDDSELCWVHLDVLEGCVSQEIVEIFQVKVVTMRDVSIQGIILIDLQLSHDERFRLLLWLLSCQHSSNALRCDRYVLMNTPFGLRQSFCKAPRFHRFE